MNVIKIKLALFTALLAVAAPSSATELLCKGRAWMTIGEGFESTALLKFDQKTLQTSLELWRGVAAGTLRLDGKLYTGLLTFPSGVQAWINLDRYTGELFVAPREAHGKPVMFLGVCEKVEPRF